MSEKDLVEFRKNPSKAFPTECKTCGHPLLAEIHPADSKSYILLES